MANPKEPTDLPERAKRGDFITQAELKAFHDYLCELELANRTERKLVQDLLVRVDPDILLDASETLDFKDAGRVSGEMRRIHAELYGPAPAGRPGTVTVRFTDLWEVLGGEVIPSPHVASIVRCVADSVLTNDAQRPDGRLMRIKHTETGKTFVIVIDGPEEGLVMVVGEEGEGGVVIKPTASDIYFEVDLSQ